ncbi:MAG: indole-3-glycerol phosphate synthase TrpC [Treponema sp.]|jgi:indole-3-glycerol phosphate synthase|nr:indole-3-glycerol phosphate synthase TrpC [Treponema sp.]
MILDDIAVSVRKRIASAREKVPFERIRVQAEKIQRKREKFEKALAEPGLSFICEVKKASPSKGVIAEDFPYLRIAQIYEEAGAHAISVLTEPEFFMGSDGHLREIAAQAAVPLLRKDFVVDEYQIYEAKVLGASAVLIIAALMEKMEKKTFPAFIETAHCIGLAALVEAHTEDEVKRAVQAGAHIIGVNNRDLRTFQVDISTTERLSKHIPDGVIMVAESGIRTADDIAVLGKRVDAVLIGESFMRAPDKRAFLKELRSMFLR